VVDVFINRPDIASGDFLGIFISASFILIFGLFYVAIFTLVKMGFLRRLYMPLAYIFWLLQIFSTYYMTIHIHSSPFTTKVMLMAMVGYLFLPHLYYYLYSLSIDKYEK